MNAVNYGRENGSEVEVHGIAQYCWKHRFCLHGLYESCSDIQTTERTAMWKFIRMLFMLLLMLLSSSSNK
jgi:hypothetical protein